MATLKILNDGIRVSAIGREAEICDFWGNCERMLTALKKSQIWDAWVYPTYSADWSDLIGCMDDEADLSVNYKAYLVVQA